MISLLDPAANLQEIHRTEKHVKQVKCEKLYRSNYTSSSTKIIRNKVGRRDLTNKLKF